MLNAKHYYSKMSVFDITNQEGILPLTCRLQFAGSADQTVRLWSPRSPESLAAEGTPLLKTFKTKATPVFHVQFMRTNVLMAAGALTLRR